MSDKVDRTTLNEIRRIAAALERIAAALEKSNAEYQGRVVVTGVSTIPTVTVKE